MDIFKDRLNEAMKARGIRATELALRTGLSKARISQYVNGKFIPKSDAVLLLAEALRVSELWLLGKTSDMEATAPTEDVLPCPENISPLRLRRFPGLGEIACGLPTLAVEDPDCSYDQGVSKAQGGWVQNARFSLSHVTRHQESGR